MEFIPLVTSKIELIYSHVMDKFIIKIKLIIIAGIYIII